MHTMLLRLSCCIPMLIFKSQLLDFSQTITVLKSFNHALHMKVIVIEISSLAKISQMKVKDSVSIVLCCYVRYLLKYAMNSDVEH